MVIDDPSKFADKFLIESSRLRNWDYSTPSLYFITICTLNHNKFFGKIVDNKMALSKRGLIAKQCLLDIPKHFKNIFIDEHIIMPNHIHLILNVRKLLSTFVETHNYASLQKRYNNYHFHRLAIKSTQTVPVAIKMYKSSVKFLCNQQQLFFAWQSRFYDHIIKNQKEYYAIRIYIKR